MAGLWFWSSCKNLEGRRTPRHCTCLGQCSRTWSAYPGSSPSHCKHNSEYYTASQWFIRECVSFIQTDSINVVILHQPLHTVVHRLTWFFTIYSNSEANEVKKIVNTKNFNFITFIMVCNESTLPSKVVLRTPF